MRCFFSFNSGLILYLFLEINLRQISSPSKQFTFCMVSYPFIYQFLLDRKTRRDESKREPSKTKEENGVKGENGVKLSRQKQHKESGVNGVYPASKLGFGV